MNDPIGECVAVALIPHAWAIWPIDTERKERALLHSQSDARDFANDRATLPS